MAPISSIFSTATSGMAVAQTAAALVSRNIANAQTPGYAREILPITIGLGGLGVQAGSPQAMRSALLERAVQGSLGRTGYFESQVSHLTIAEQGVNDLDGSGVGPSLEAFQSAMSALSANPSSTDQRQAVMNAARDLGDAFASTRSQLDLTARGVRDDARASVDKINSLTAQIAQIDQRIRGARPGEERNTYATQRAALVEQVASLIDVETRTNADGTITLKTAGGRALVNGGVANKVVVTQDAPPKSTLTLAFEAPDGGKLDPIAGNDFGGRLGGLLSMYNDTVMPAIEDLDQLAFDFTSSFNAIHQGGFRADGSPGGDFFEAPLSVEGAAARVGLATGFTPNDVAAGLDPSAGAGDNGNLEFLMNAAGESGQLAGGLSVPATWRQIAGSVSRALSSAKSGAEFETASKEQLENLLASESGVSIDEEMFNLTQAQAALEASSNVIAVAQQMTDTVMSLVG